MGALKRLSAARAFISGLLLLVLAETAADATPDEWLREWLSKLAVKILSLIHISEPTRPY